jgi:hypothetical protein
MMIMDGFLLAEHRINSKFLAKKAAGVIVMERWEEERFQRGSRQTAIGVLSLSFSNTQRSSLFWSAFFFLPVGCGR